MLGIASVIFPRILVKTVVKSCITFGRLAASIVVTDVIVLPKLSKTWVIPPALKSPVFIQAVTNETIKEIIRPNGPEIPNAASATFVRTFTKRPTAKPALSKVPPNCPNKLLPNCKPLAKTPVSTRPIVEKIVAIFSKPTAKNCLKTAITC